jgi:hypothetical protein
MSEYWSLIFILFLWTVFFSFFGSYIWRNALHWLKRCPFLHSDECLNGAWQDGECSCGRLEKP